METLNKINKNRIIERINRLSNIFKIIHDIGSIDIYISTIRTIINTIKQLNEFDDLTYIEFQIFDFGREMEKTISNLIKRYNFLKGGERLYKEWGDPRQLEKNKITLNKINEIKRDIYKIIRLLTSALNTISNYDEDHINSIKENTLSEYDRLINENETIDENVLEDILNLKLKTNIPLTEGQFKKISSNIDKKYYLDAISDKKDKKTGKYKILRRYVLHSLTISTVLRNYLLEYNQPEMEAKEIVKAGSDVIELYYINNIKKFKVSEIPEENYKENKDGRFFEYINTTDIDLSRYQIYNEEQIKDTNKIEKREQCLIHALKLSGIKENEINIIKSSFFNSRNEVNYRKSITRKNLHDIAKITNSQIILHEHSSNKNRKILFGDKNSSDKINIAIYKNHYFIYEELKYTSYFIKNYNELKNIKNRESIYTKKATGYYERKKNPKINSLALIRTLFENGHFKKIDKEYLKFIETMKLTPQNTNLSINKIEQRKHKYIEKPSKDIEVFYCDTESFINNKDGHELFLLGFVSNNMKNTRILNVCDFNDEQHLVNTFIKIITKDGNRDVICYFHNWKYDNAIIGDYLNNVSGIVEKDSSKYSKTIIYKKRKVEFRCSYHIISSPLSKFQKMFELRKKYSKKEALPYNYYTKKNYNKIISVDNKKFLKYLSKDELEIFNKEIEDIKNMEEINKKIKEEIEKIEKSNIKNKKKIIEDLEDSIIVNDIGFNKEENTFSPLEYYIRYLKMDCLVLMEGLNKFNKVLEDIYRKIDKNIKTTKITDKLTISSIADDLVKKFKSFEGCYEVGGSIRDYISSSVYGGRVHANEKYVKKIIEGKINSFDGVSLYPSAIVRICREIGIPAGKAKLIPRENLSNEEWINNEKWREYKHGVFTVKINKVNKIQQMPIIAHRTEDSIEYLNKAPEKPIVIDKITLEDYIKLHKIEYEILDGIYWNKTNKTMGELVSKLFNERLKAKNEGNRSLSEILKLMLNSIYGKTVTKKTYKRKAIVYENNINRYSLNYFNTIDHMYKINKNQYVVVMDSMDTSYNLCHIGGMILSMARRIMNEIFDICNSNSIPIYYTDTDSIHMDIDKIKKLSELYKKEYNKELVGNELEQFNEDLEIDDCKNVYAYKSIFLGKKCYIDMLVGEDKNTGEIKHSEVFRMKGITVAGIKDVVKKKFNNDIFELYKYLSIDNNEVEITLNPYDEENNKQYVQFEFSKTNNVKTKEIFTRKVSF